MQLPVCVARAPLRVAVTAYQWSCYSVDLWAWSTPSPLVPSAPSSTALPGPPVPLCSLSLHCSPACSSTHSLWPSKCHLKMIFLQHKSDHIFILYIFLGLLISSLDSTQRQLHDAACLFWAYFAPFHLRLFSSLSEWLGISHLGPLLMLHALPN